MWSATRYVPICIKLSHPPANPGSTWLIVYQLPSDVYRKRQKAAIKAAKRKGRSIQPVIFEISQAHVFHHQCPCHPVVHGGRRHSVPPPLASGAGFQELEIAVPDQCSERHPARTHSLPHLWPANRHPGSAPLVVTGIRPSSGRAAGAFLLQG